MTLPIPNNSPILIRPLQYGDLEAIATVMADAAEGNGYLDSATLAKQLERMRSWYGLLKCLSWFPNPWQHHFSVYVAERQQQLCGLIQVSPFNSSRSTWRVDRVLVERSFPQLEIATGNQGIGSQLLRHCFEKIWEARTWLLEVNINAQDSLALYRQNGFQPLAQITYWAIAPQLLEQLAQNEPNLPNLLPVSNADAQLLYQLDCVSMPPLLRQVFDRHIQDFKINLLSKLLRKMKQWFGQEEVVQCYVFEPQRKAAIGYFKLELYQDGSQPHQAQLTVHPAYTWLYPQLLTLMAQIGQKMPPQSLHLTSADYQPEREEYLENLGAQRIEHILLMSRSVWHKLRETKPLEGLQLSDVLKGLQPARTPIPSRMSWLDSTAPSPPQPPTPPEVRSEITTVNNQPATLNQQQSTNREHPIFEDLISN